MAVGNEYESETAILSSQLNGEALKEILTQRIVAGCRAAASVKGCGIMAVGVAESHF